MSASTNEGVRKGAQRDLPSNTQIQLQTGSRNFELGKEHIITIIFSSDSEKSLSASSEAKVRTGACARVHPCREGRVQKRPQGRMQTRK